MSRKEPQPLPPGRKPAPPSPPPPCKSAPLYKPAPPPPVNKRTARGTGETGLTAAQIERLQAAIKEVTYGKLIITIQDNKILGYVVEKSEKFA